MENSPRMGKSVAHGGTGRKSGEVVLTDEAVLDEALGQVLSNLNLARPGGARYDAETLLSVVLYASSQAITINQACRQLADAPHANTVRGGLSDLTLATVEPEMNAALAGTWPKTLVRRPLEIAIDVTLIPYYGELEESDSDYLLSGAAKAGTTTFLGYATLYAIKKNKRFTLAMTPVRRSTGMVGVLQRLLTRLAALGGRVRCLYLDRQFYQVAALRYLIEERDVPCVVAARKTGTTGGVKGLIARHGPGMHDYTVTRPEAGTLDVQLAVVGKYFNGRWGKHGHTHYAYVVHRFPFKLQTLFGKYRHRFGIEASYRLETMARARTASRQIPLRWLLISCAMLLYNVWVFLKWARVSWPRRGGRLVFEDLFPFQQCLAFLRQAIEQRFGVVRQVLILPPPHPL